MIDMHEPHVPTHPEVWRSTRRGDNCKRWEGILTVRDPTISSDVIFTRYTVTMREMETLQMEFETILIKESVPDPSNPTTSISIVGCQQLLQRFCSAYQETWWDAVLPRIFVILDSNRDDRIEFAEFLGVAEVCTCDIW